MKSANEIRRDFISYFEGKQHKFVRSSPVVPIDDPTLLFTNAGMNQFKPIFLGEKDPEFSRAVNSQKCIRVSGKHNDLEEVGVDNFHHTFFEMLGNWSFGDYYKAEAIEWAWELLTDVWGLDKNRLWVTVFETDDEAARLWVERTDIAPERVLRFGTKDNFWEMGETGPCGPCSEIHYYNGADINQMKAAGVNVLPEYREIWNLVFIQYNRLDDGELLELPHKHVDTGAGFERIVGILQNHDSNYATDLFTPIINEISELTGVTYTEEDGVAHQVVADHIRMISFSLADGALPGNEGRGYVVRRILRRAARFSRILGQHEPFLYRLVDTLVETMGEAFPELIEQQQHIKKVIKAEESNFGETLDRGLEVFSKVAEKLESGGTITGEDAFRLYDTYGFPIDLTELMAREQEFSVDTDGFDRAMNAQRDRARGSVKGVEQASEVNWITVSKGKSSKFLGYDKTKTKSKISKYRDMGDGNIQLILDQTPFYAESGGQIGDRGIITGRINDFKAAISDVQHITVDKVDEIVHIGEYEGSLKELLEVEAEIDGERRQAIILNHTATHLMQAALKTVLGEHVNQTGSLVEPERLRFDLTHYDKLTNDQIDEIETIVNREIARDTKVTAKVMSFEKAKSTGAMALFGEKYGAEVRVVDIPGFSRELCGGTHVDRTGLIGAFKIISETGLAAGVRRIQAVTGKGVAGYFDERFTALEHELDLLKQKNRTLEKEFKSISNVSTQGPADSIMGKRETAGDVAFVASTVDVSDKDNFRNLVVAGYDDEKIKALEQDVELVKQRNRSLEKEIRNLSKVRAQGQADSLMGNRDKVGDVAFIAATVEVSDKDDFKDLAVDLKNRLQGGVVVLGTVINDKPQLVVAVSDTLKNSIPAGKLVKELGQLLGGGGGGSPILATAGGKDTSRLAETIAAVKNILSNHMGEK
jgi:alanyl-tRNA synthetase